MDESDSFYCLNELFKEEEDTPVLKPPKKIFQIKKLNINKEDKLIISLGQTYSIYFDINNINQL